MNQNPTGGGLRDQSDLAETLLDHVLEENKEAEAIESGARVTVAAALDRGQLVQREQTGREKLRVLFVTADPEVLDADSAAARFFATVEDQFSEMHIVVAVPAAVHPKRVERRSERTWIYATGHRFSYGSKHALRTVVNEQLVFTDGFRPDVVVSLDVFSVGYAAYKIAQHYERPFQVHMSDPVYDPLWQKKHAITASQRRVHKRLMRRVTHLRVQGDHVLDATLVRYAHIIDQALLPQQYDITGLLATADTPADPELLADHALTFLYVGDLSHESKLYQAIDAVRVPLRSPSIALVVLGDGPAKKEFAERARILGVAERVIFVSDDSRALTYMASAHVLLCPEESAVRDRTILQAAAVGLPVIAAHNQMRDALFTDSENMGLFEPNDTAAFTERVNKLLNNSALRLQYKNQAQDIVKSRLHEDPTALSLIHI